MDEHGKSIADDVLLSGNVGDSYEVDEKHISGYLFKEVQGNESGLFTDQAQIVTLVYNKVETSTPTKPVVDGKLIVEYIDESGKDIENPVITIGKAGTSYKTEKKDIKGYAFKEVKGNETGKYTAKDQTVTYVYKREEAIIPGTNMPTKPVNPKTNTPTVPVIENGGNDSNSDSSTNGSNSTTNNKNNEVVNNVVENVQTLLPKTSAQKATLIGSVMLNLVSLAGLITWKKRK